MVACTSRTELTACPSFISSGEYAVLLFYFFPSSAAFVSVFPFAEKWVAALNIMEIRLQ